MPSGCRKGADCPFLHTKKTKQDHVKSRLGSGGQKKAPPSKQAMGDAREILKRKRASKVAARVGNGNGNANRSEDRREDRGEERVAKKQKNLSAITGETEEEIALAKARRQARFGTPSTTPSAVTTTTPTLSAPPANQPAPPSNQPAPLSKPMDVVATPAPQPTPATPTVPAPAPPPAAAAPAASAPAPVPDFEDDADSVLDEEPPTTNTGGGDDDDFLAMLDGVLNDDDL